MGLTGLRRGSRKVPKNFEQKLEKKCRFYEKVKDDVVSLAVKKAIGKKKRTRSRQKKLKAYDLSALSEFLPKVDVPPPQPNAAKLKLSCKSRKKLVEREGEQFKAVLNHPAFQLDPISAIHQHLELTQPPVVNQENRSGETGKKAKRKKTKRPSSGSQSMEI